MADKREPPLVETDKDKVDLQEILADTFRRFHLKKQERNDREQKQEQKPHETKSAPVDPAEDANRPCCTLLTFKKNKDGGYDVTHSDPTKPSTPDPTVRPKTSGSNPFETASTPATPSIEKKRGPVTRPKLYTEEELWRQWHDAPPQPEMYEPVSVTLEKMQRDNELDNVLCKLREETTPVDKSRYPSRSDMLRIVLDFTDVYSAVETHVKDDDECKRIFRNLFHHDLKILLIRYINIFKIPTDVFLG